MAEREIHAGLPQGIHFTTFKEIKVARNQAEKIHNKLEEMKKISRGRVKIQE